VTAGVQYVQCLYKSPTTSSTRGRDNLKNIEASKLNATIMQAQFDSVARINFETPMGDLNHDGKARTSDEHESIYEKAGDCRVTKVPLARGLSYI
jgi:hypothetical protein